MNANTDNRIPNTESDIGDQESEELDTKEAINQVKRIYNRLDVKDLLLITMILLMFLMYMFHTQQIQACSDFFNDIIRNNTNTLLWSSDMNYTKIVGVI